MEYTWNLIGITSIVIGILFTFLFKRVSIVNDMIEHANMIVEKMSLKYNAEYIHSVRTTLYETNDEIMKYIRDGGITILLVAITFLAKVADLTVVWAPFWASVLFGFFVLFNIFKLRKLTLISYSIIQTLEIDDVINETLSAMKKESNIIENTPTPDLDLIKDKDYDIKN